MEEKISERFRDHINERLTNLVTYTAVEEAIQKVNDNAMSYAYKARVDIKEDLTVNFAQDMKENIKTEITGDLQEAQSLLQETRLQVKEQLDKEARRNNIIVYRAPESTKTTVEEKIRDDREYVMELFNEVLEADCNVDDIKKMFRLGARGEYSRPLLIECKSRQVKNLIIESAGRLRGAPQKFKGISVTRDMTIAERAQCKDAVAEANTKTAADTSGEWKFVVRGPPGEMKVFKVKIRPQQY